MATGNHSSAPKVPATILLSTTESQPIQVWHQRLGHVNFEKIKKIETSGVVNGLSISSSNVPKFCEGCVFGKHHRQPFPTNGRHRAKRVGEIIYSDLVGPVSVTSPGGARYFVIFNDDYSGYFSVSFLKNKSETSALFQNFAQRIEIETGNKINTHRTDNGGEYVGYLLKSGLKQKAFAMKLPFRIRLNKMEFLKGRTEVSARPREACCIFPTNQWSYEPKQQTVPFIFSTV